MASRFDPNLVTDEELLRELKRVSNQLGKTPSRPELETHGKYSAYCYRKRFGSMKAACEAAGITANVGGSGFKYNKQDLIDAFNELKNKLGYTPAQTDITDKGKYPIDAYKRHFGNYNNFLDSIGVQHNKTVHNFTTDDIKKDIIRIAQLLGQSPTKEEFQQHTTTTIWTTAAYKISGVRDWNATLKLCGLTPISKGV